MSEPEVLFQNQMAKSNWAYIVLAFALAIPFIVAQGASLAFAAMICGGLAVCACAFAMALIAFMGRHNVGVLRLRGKDLEAEMLSVWGAGRRRRMPLAEIEDWRLTRTWPTLRFRHGGRDFNLPLHGATIDWPALRRIAPHIREIPR